MRSENKNSNKRVELPFEYMIVSGEEALKTCLRIREDYKGKFTPVIIGTYDDVRNLADSLAYNKDSAEDIIRNSLNYNAETLVQGRLEEDAEYYEGVEQGEWPEDPEQMTDIISDKDIMSGRYLKEVYIALIPTGNSYEVPAYLKFGDWNECPGPEEQVGILRYWFNKYGAQVIAMTSDVIEYTVDNPPMTKEQALDLAKEQFYYCSDIVFQGTENISILAGSLYKSKYWYFWWD